MNNTKEKRSEEKRRKLSFTTGKNIISTGVVDCRQEKDKYEMFKLS